MLRPVVGKYPLHLPHPGNEEHIGKEDHHADHALHQVQQQRGFDPPVKEASHHHGQQEEQSDGESQSHGYGDVQHRLLEFFIPQLPFLYVLLLQCLAVC